MRYSFRWFGPKDPTSLSFIKQTGAREIVSSLADEKYGETWSAEKIKKRQNLIKKNKDNSKIQLKWSVVESLPVHNDIKLRTGKFKYYTEKYLDSLNNLAKCKINIVCYNFMPVVDWLRTDLTFRTSDGSIALRYDHIEMCIFECLILKIRDAESRYSAKQINEAKNKFKKMSNKEINDLMNALMGGLAATDRKYSLRNLKYEISRYSELSHLDLQNNLKDFLNNIFSILKEKKIYYCIHPDDPPFPIYGLPRIVSNENDIKYITSLFKDEYVGITLCTGSLGVKKENNIPSIIKKFGKYINFIHLRNIRREKTKYNFYESSHLEGEINMIKVIKSILREEKIRKKNKHNNSQIPMRPDHGQSILYDQNNKTIPGYSLLGRMKGLAELKGLIKSLDG